MPDNLKPRTAPDPAFDREDYQSEAILAQLEGRITENDRQVFAKRREQDAARRRGVHLRAIQHLPVRAVDDPASTAERHDLFLNLCTRIGRKDPEALLVESLRANGLKVVEVARVLGKSPSHVSRFRKLSREMVVVERV